MRFSLHPGDSGQPVSVMLFMTSSEEKSGERSLHKHHENVTKCVHGNEKLKKIPLQPSGCLIKANIDCQLTNR